MKMIASVFLLLAGSLAGEQVMTRYSEGLVHGFLVLRDIDDKVLASGELLQVANGVRVTSEMALRFPDGSVYEETTVFSQRRTIQLLTYHLVQKGKAFKHPTDLRIDMSTGVVKVVSDDDGGKEKVYTETMKLPADLANGLVPILLKDVDPKALSTRVSMVVATPKPRLVKLLIQPDEAKDSFSVFGVGHPALRYTVRVELGGLAGAVAPIIGKQPPDTHVWMMGGKAPAYLKAVGQFYEDGPIWKIELASPVWPRVDSSR